MHAWVCNCSGWVILMNFDGAKQYLFSLKYHCVASLNTNNKQKSLGLSIHSKPLQVSAYSVGNLFD